MRVARAANVGVPDWRAVGGRLWRVVAIELVVEDRSHRAIAERADLDRAGAGGVQARGAKRSRQADNAKTSAEALLGVWPMSRICSHSAAVAGPMRAASSRMRTMVQPA